MNLTKRRGVMTVHNDPNLGVNPPDSTRNSNQGQIKSDSASVSYGHSSTVQNPGVGANKAITDIFKENLKKLNELEKLIDELNKNKPLLNSLQVVKQLTENIAKLNEKIKNVSNEKKLRPQLLELEAERNKIIKQTEDFESQLEDLQIKKIKAEIELAKPLGTAIASFEDDASNLPALLIELEKFIEALPERGSEIALELLSRSEIKKEAIAKVFESVIDKIQNKCDEKRQEIEKNKKDISFYYNFIRQIDETPGERSSFDDFRLTSLKIKVLEPKNDLVTNVKELEKLNINLNGLKKILENINTPE